MKQVLRYTAINGWRLFALATVPMSFFLVLAMMAGDLSTAEGVSSMIATSVRWSVPWLYLAFAASSLQVLFPSEAGRWLLRNRKFIGLSFAAGMAWQASFIRGRGAVAESQESVPGHWRPLPSPPYRASGRGG